MHKLYRVALAVVFATAGIVGTGVNPASAVISVDAASNPITLSVNVNTALTITVNQSSYSFGAQNPGVVATSAPGAITYSVTSNNIGSDGVHVALMNGVGQACLTDFPYQEKHDAAATFTSIPCGGGAFAELAPPVMTTGTTNYSDTLRVAIGANAAAGSAGSTFTYRLYTFINA